MNIKKIYKNMAKIYLIISLSTIVLLFLLVVFTPKIITFLL